MHMERGISQTFVLVDTDANDDSPAKFHTRFSFESLPDNPLTKILQIQMILKAVKTPGQAARNGLNY